MLKKLQIKSRPNYRGLLSDYTGYALFNTDKISKFAANSSTATDTDIYYKETDDSRVTPVRFTVEETTTQVTDYKDTANATNSIKLGFLEEGYSEDATYEYIDVDNIIYGINDVGNSSSSSVLSISGKQGAQYVEQTIEQIEALSEDGGVLTSFSIAVGEDSYTGTIDTDARTVAVTLPAGTTVTSLVATFTVFGDIVDAVKVGGVTQTSGTTTNNFTSAVEYDLFDGTSELATYTVTVTVTTTTAAPTTTTAAPTTTTAAPTTTTAAPTTTTTTSA